jgi:hypothetical protein
VTPQETVLLVAYVKACCPQQAIGEYTPDAWHDLLGDLSLADCRDAVAAVAKRQPFVAPAEIRAEVRRLRAERLAASVIPAPPAELADNPRAYQAALQARIRDAADGRGDVVPPAIGGPDLSQRAGHSSSLRGAVAGLKAKLGPPLPPRGIESPRQIAARQAEAHRLRQESAEGEEAS